MQKGNPQDWITKRVPQPVQESTAPWIRVVRSFLNFTANYSAKGWAYRSALSETNRSISQLMLCPRTLKQTPRCDVLSAYQADGIFAGIPNVCLQDLPHHPQLGPWAVILDDSSEKKGDLHS